MKLIGHPFWLPEHLESSFPTLSGNLRTQVVVVGGSYSGLTAAYYLSKQGYDVILLEANLIGKASSRSAGVLSSSLERDFIDYVEEYGFEQAVRLWTFSVAGVQLVKKILEDTFLLEETEFEEPGSLYLADIEHQKYMQEEAIARQKAGFETRYFEKILNPLHENGAILGILTPGDAIINPFKFSQLLAKKLAETGVRIYENSKVIQIDKKKGICITEHGAITADKIALVGQNVPGQFGYKKGQFSILTFCMATEQLSEQKLESLGLKNRYSFWDSEMPFFYGRLTSDNRLILGGEDLWLPMAQLGLDRVKMRRLTNQLREKIPSLNDIEIEYRWGGPFYVTADAMPVIGQDERIVYTGNAAGISQAVLSGRIISGLVGDYQDEFAEVLKFKRDLFPKLYSYRELFHLVLELLGIF